MKTPTFLARQILQDSEAAARFIYEELGYQLVHPFIGLVVISDMGTIGAAIFNNFHPGLSVDMTAAGPGAWGIREARALAYYAFVVLNCRRVTAITSDKNLKARHALRSLGFRKEGFMRERFGSNNHGIVFGLLRREQRLIKIERPTTA